MNSDFLDLFHIVFEYCPMIDTELAVANLQTTVGLLPERMRQAICLRYIEHRSLQQIGDEMHMTKQGAAYAIDKAKQTLRCAPYSWLLLGMVRFPSLPFPSDGIDPKVICVNDWSIYDMCTDTRIESALQKNRIYTVEQFLSAFDNNVRFDEHIARYMTTLHSAWNTVCCRCSRLKSCVRRISSPNVLTDSELTLQFLTANRIQTVDEFLHFDFVNAMLNNADFASNNDYSIVLRELCEINLLLVAMANHTVIIGQEEGYRRYRQYLRQFADCNTVEGESPLRFEEWYRNGKIILYSPVMYDLAQTDINHWHITDVCVFHPVLNACFDVGCQTVGDFMTRMKNEQPFYANPATYRKMVELYELLRCFSSYNHGCFSGSNHITDLVLSERARNILNREQITTLDQLRRIQTEWIFEWRNCGWKTGCEIALLKQLLVASKCLSA